MLTSTTLPEHFVVSPVAATTASSLTKSPTLTVAFPLIGIICSFLAETKSNLLTSLSVDCLMLAVESSIERTCVFVTGVLGSII